MKKGLPIIENSIAKLIAVIVVPGSIMGAILLGTPIFAFLNIPSLLIVVVLLGGGLMFSFGIIFPIKSFLNAFLINEPLEKMDLKLSIQLFDYASSLSIGAGIIGSMI